MVQGLEDFKVAERGVIEREEFVAGIEGDPGKAGDVSAQVLGEVMDDSASRADGSGVVFQAETIERSHFEVVAHGEQGRLRGKHPVVVAVQHPTLGRGGANG